MFLTVAAENPTRSVREKIKEAISTFDLRFGVPAKMIMISPEDFSQLNNNNLSSDLGVKIKPNICIPCDEYWLTDSTPTWT